MSLELHQRGIPAFLFWYEGPRGPRSVGVAAGGSTATEPTVCSRDRHRQPDFTGDSSVGGDRDGGGQMGILPDDMKRLVDEQKLAFHATVCPDSLPNLSLMG